MATNISKQKDKDITVEEKLRMMYRLQAISSKIDSIKTLRGELPLEVRDLEDEIAGLETREVNYKEDVDEFKKSISERKNQMVDSKELIKKYKEQQNNVRNNREFDSLSKEIEFQGLEIELSEKRIKEHTKEIEEKNQFIKSSNKILKEKQEDLTLKKAELESIVSETQKDEDDLMDQAENIAEKIDSRLSTAFYRIRGNTKNGLAVVSYERDACGGCFNRIPPQRQLDISNRKKIIICEYCGRILVDSEIASQETV